MSNVVKQLKTNTRSVLILDAEPPRTWKKKIDIEGQVYDTDIVYDLKNAIAIKSQTDVVGKHVEFI